MIGSICGTPEDPQDYVCQRQKLEAEGVFVAESNADAAGIARDMLVAIMALNSVVEKDTPGDEALFLKEQPAVINLGIPIFESGPRAAGANVVPVLWSPGTTVSEEIKTLLDGLL